jgi:hypothetical protein
MHNSEITPKVNIGELIAYPLSNDASSLSMKISDDAMLNMAMTLYHQ